MTLAFALCIFGTLLGTGVIGERVAETAGGALSTEATHLAPASTAFSIWSVIYAGLLAYTIWQWLPGRAAHPRHRAIGWLAAASMVLNAAWLLVTQLDWLWVSVAVIVALLAVLVALVRRLERTPGEGAVGTLVTEGTFGLYLGWVTIATVANIASTLGASGFRPEGALADTLAVVVLAVVTVIGIALARSFGARIAVSAALAWGLSWITVERFTGEPYSPPTAIAALIAALVVIAVTVALRVRRREAPTS